MLELRAKVKSWERNFEAENNRKPTSSDIKGDKSVLHMYQQYKMERRRGLNSEQLQKDSNKRENSNESIPGTPKKSNGQVKATVQNGQDSDTENDEPTPLVRKVSEVFPTPSMRGKVLGLFDMEINSPYNSPKKGSNMSDSSPLSKTRPNVVTTPSRSIEPETPQSKRTPEYFFQKVNLFPPQGNPMPIPKLFSTAKSEGSSQSAESNEVSNFMDEVPDLHHPHQTVLPIMDSPLVKQKTSRTKSVSDLVKEASLLNSSQRIEEDGELAENNMVLQFDTNDKTGEFPGGEDSHTPQGEHENTTMIDEFDDDLTNENAKTLESAPMMFDSSGIGKGKRKPKRQTKRVIMRPIDESQEISKAKPTENYRRLTINNSARNNFKRRRRG